MYRTILFLLLFISPLSQGKAYSQKTTGNQPSQTIRGTVIDKASGHSMPDVTIMLSDMPGTGTTTDERGQFVLPEIPVGRHNVQASFLGYEPGIFSEILVTSAKEVYLDISLKENVNELSEVVVRPQINKEQPRTCCNGEWKMWRYRILTTLPIYPYWAAVSYHHSAARFWVIPTSSQVPFPPNTGMPFPVYST